MATKYKVSAVLVQNDLCVLYAPDSSAFCPRLIYLSPYETLPAAPILNPTRADAACFVEGELQYIFLFERVAQQQEKGLFSAGE